MKTRIALFAFLLATGSALAQTPAVQQPGGTNSQYQNSGGGQSQRPEIAACSGKANGSACSFAGRQGEQITGSCFSPPAGGPGGDKPACCRPDFGRK